MRDIEEYILTLFDEKGYDLTEDVLDGVFGLDIYAVAEYVANSNRGDQEIITTDDMGDFITIRDKVVDIVRDYGLILADIYEI